MKIIIDFMLSSGLNFPLSLYALLINQICFLSYSIICCQVSRMCINVFSRLVLCLVYHAIYLEELTAVELTEKLAQLFSISPRQISQIFKQGPTGIHVLVSDEVSVVVLFRPICLFYLCSLKLFYDRTCINK